MTTPKPDLPGWPPERVQAPRVASMHGATDPVEGAMWRVERQGKVDFLAKFVVEGKVDGAYLPEIAGCAPIWNWRPEPRA